MKLEVMSSEETNISSKYSRRRASHDAHSVINMDNGGRREIGHALQHQRSSPSPSTPHVTEPIVKGNINSNNEIDVSMCSDAKYCYYLLEAMPLPGPTWSSTGPSLLAEPTPLTPLGWGESQASSYSWWLGFLQGLDAKNVTNEKLDSQSSVENFVTENSKGVSSYESTFVDDALNLSCYPDDRLVIPSLEKDLGDMVMP
ncbi:hypothetical protein RJT34_17689 [Clitoria ternatea]|uniref:Uncharacterized protein n=1 Tax=Clitoria ternatea TaxID=43366 RepID=A0AAN9JBL9_CLITE